jgi:hypothetical protein
MRTFSVLSLAVAAAAFSTLADAGRPLATDDAATADVGTCQLESYVERGDGARAWVLAPACGVAKGLEVGVELVRFSPRDVISSGAAVAFKYAPENWKTSTAAGPVTMGLKAGASFLRVTGSGWEGSEVGVLGLATLTPNGDVAVHANVGFTRERITSKSALIYNLAGTWAPAEPWLVFAEAQANSRSEIFGKTVFSYGGRWWAVKDKVGIDLTRSTQSGGGSSWSIGFGWYGIGL